MEALQVCALMVMQGECVELQDLLCSSQRIGVCCCCLHIHHCCCRFHCYAHCCCGHSDTYIVKTISEEEATFFVKSILPQYYNRVRHSKYKRRFCPVCRSPEVAACASVTAPNDGYGGHACVPYIVGCSADHSFSVALHRVALCCRYKPLMAANEGWMRCEAVGCGHEYCIDHGDAHPSGVKCSEYENRHTANEQMEDVGCSLLMKVLGVYRVRLHPFQSFVYFMVMEKLGKGLAPELKFDLKGSNNAAKPGQETKRDLDLRRMLASGEIQFSLTNPKSFEQKIGGDVAMLQELGLMDYSLLVFVLKPEELSLNELKAFLDQYTEQVDRLAETVEKSFGKTKSVSGLQGRLHDLTKYLAERQTTLTQSVDQAAGEEAHEADELLDLDPAVVEKVNQVIDNISLLQNHDANAKHRGAWSSFSASSSAVYRPGTCHNDCNNSCLACLIKKAGKVKQQRAEHLLQAQSASLNNLTQALSHMLMGQGATQQSRSKLLADSVVGKCTWQVPPLLHCCLLTWHTSSPLHCCSHSIRGLLTAPCFSGQAVRAGVLYHRLGKHLELTGTADTVW